MYTNSKCSSYSLQYCLSQHIIIDIHSNLRYIIIIIDAVQSTACIKYNLLNISQVCVEAAAIGPYCCDLQSG